MKIASCNYNYNYKCPSFRAENTESLQKKGSLDSRKGAFDEAIAEFKKVLTQNPKNEEAQLELAKAYKQKEDYQNALVEFYKYVELNNKNNEAYVLMADCFRQQGFYPKAIFILEQIVKRDPKNDFAARTLKEAQNQLYFIQNPMSAYNQLCLTKKNSMEIAVKLAKDFLPKGFTDDLKDVKITFDETKKLAGYANIAQYEHAKQQISLSNDYIWASPKLLAAYIVHEYVHAKDKDAYTSIAEEQDAFRMQAEYWQKNGKGITDPEMDYILDLYKQSPQTLDARVKEIYSLRDNGIPATSPNHPKDNKLSIFERITSHLIKYDTIA